MDSNIRISVIIPVYNGETFLGRCIRSLIKQSLKNDFYEIILINDGSTDHTKEILENYIDYIKVIQHIKNKGLAISCNQGIKKALGSYIIRVDADDYVHQDLLLFSKAILDWNSNISFVWTDHHLIDKNEKIIIRAA